MVVFICIKCSHLKKLHSTYQTNPQVSITQHNNHKWNKPTHNDCTNIYSRCINNSNNSNNKVVTNQYISNNKVVTNKCLKCGSSEMNTNVFFIWNTASNIILETLVTKALNKIFLLTKKQLNPISKTQENMTSAPKKNFQYLTAWCCPLILVLFFRFHGGGWSIVVIRGISTVVTVGII